MKPPRLIGDSMKLKDNRDRWRRLALELLERLEARALHEFDRMQIKQLRATAEKLKEAE